MFKPYLLHPALVHFPIALLLTGAAAACVGARAGDEGRRAGVVSWLLWLGTASAWAAAGLGLLAEKTAPHVPTAWQTLNAHRTLAFWALGLFTVLSLWRALARERRPLLFLAAWLCACAVLAAAAYEGGELVFVHNMGTQASEP